MKNKLSPFTLIFWLLVLSGLAACSGGAQTLTVDAAPSPSLAEEAIADASFQSPPTLPSVASPAPADPESAFLNALAQEQAYINIYETVNPAVVHINVGNGQGSGFVYSQEGIIVTNNHVVAGARQINVTFADGTVVPAAVVGTDPASDLAVLRVDPQQAPLTAVPLGDSDALRVGQIVIAIGSPFGLESTMTTGIISALNRLYPGASEFQIPDIIQTDAAINPGNSGGPLINLYGQVIGVNAAIESPVRGSSGIGYAIPSNIVAHVVPQIIAEGRVQHTWLGIRGASITPGNAAQLGLDRDQKGVLVSEVIGGGPAALAGLRPANTAAGQFGDVIVGIDDRPVTSFDDLLGYLVQYTAVGQTIQLNILRDGSLQTVPLTLQARPTTS